MKQPKKKQGKKKNNNQKEERINLSNEIIIGLTPKNEDNKKSKKKVSKKKAKKPNSKQIKQKVNIQSKKKNIKKEKGKSKKKIQIIKWTTLIILIILTIVLFLGSSIFNIREIKVENNEKISEEEIIKLSTLKKDMNMFKFSKTGVTKAIKSNPYIEDVKIKRKINGEIILEITERKPTYMLKFANAFVYINNQGYILELSETPLELPIITGFKTPTEEIKEGNRLNISDLEKLEDIIKIMNSAAETPLIDLITIIDISENNNYKIELEDEDKIVQFGPATNISVKLLKIQEVLENEEGNSGEIYFQDSERTVFKENV